MDSRYAADVDLARRCAAGDPLAWERFVAEYRPVLYRAADALDPRGGARDIADSLYAELYGVKDGVKDARSAERESLLRYFQGRSSLATWLRAVLAQRYVDRLRAQRRLEPLPDEEQSDRASERSLRAANRDEPADPNRARYLTLLADALSRALARLPAVDRLRLACYYVQELTLAETGRLLKEHEATSSRHLARSRRVIRLDVERQLRDAGLQDDQIAACFASVVEDPGPLDLKPLLRESLQ